MKAIKDIKREFDCMLPSEFLLTNVFYFFVEPIAIEQKFKILNCDLFKELMPTIIPKFLRQYILENKTLVFKSYGIAEFSIDYYSSDFLVYDPNVKLAADMRDFLLEPIQNLSNPEQELEIRNVDIVKSFVKGFLFCKQLKISNSKNILFIEQLFIKPAGFDEVFNKMQSQKNKLTILTGEPRSGKTYSAHYMLFKFHIEKNCRIFHCINLSRFDQLLTDTSNYYKNDEVVIYYEDPFGFSNFYGQEIARILTKLTEAQKIANLRVVVTSRKQLFLSGVQETDDVLKNSLIINYKFNKGLEASDDIDNKDFFDCIYYDISKLKLIIQRISWLYKATWSKSFSNYLNKPNVEFIWSRLEYSRFSPGSIYESFLISSALPEFTFKEFDQIQQLFLSGGDDLMAAFGSEIKTFVKRETGFYLKLFFILPAITIIESEQTIRNILGDHYNEISKHKDILKKQQESPFSKESLTYYHPVFGEAVDRYLFNYGYSEFLEDDGLISFFTKLKKMSEKEFVRDFICFIYYLDFVKNVKKDRQKTVNHSIGIAVLVKDILDSEKELYGETTLYKEILAIKFFYGSITNDNISQKAKKAGIQQFLRNTISDRENLKFFPYLGSVLEHQIFFRLKYFKDDKLPITINNFIDAISETFRQQSGDNKNDPFLVYSVFLHSIFANLEYLLYYNIALDKNQFFISLDKTIKSIEKKYKNSHDPIFLDISIIWLDAIMMKFSELHQYLIETENLVGRLSSENVVNSNNKIELDLNSLKLSVVNCGKLKDELFKIFIDFWNRIYEKELNKDYLRGALSFSLIWHNRWNFDVGFREFILWLKKLNLRDPKSKLYDNSFRDGFLYNARYHYGYFMARNNSWARESSIMIWKVDKPRKGANALYESGIIYWDGKKDDAIKNQEINVDEVEVFTEIINVLFRENDLNVEAISQVLYLVGLRFEKNQKYYAPLVNDIKTKLSSAKNENIKKVINQLSGDLAVCGLNLFSKEIIND